MFRSQTRALHPIESNLFFIQKCSVFTKPARKTVMWPRQSHHLLQPMIQKFNIRTVLPFYDCYSVDSNTFNPISFSGLPGVLCWTAESRWVERR